jgi:hypothetical protein
LGGAPAPEPPDQGAGETGESMGAADESGEGNDEPMETDAQPPVAAETAVVEAPPAAEALAEPPRHLVESVTYASRALEAVLTAGETVRLFVEAGGVDLMLRLYRLPGLPATFGSTNASHSLLMAFRALLGHVSPADTAKVFASMKTVLQELLSAAMEATAVVGPAACVPELPATEQEVYVRHVSSTEGVAAVAATVVRNSATLLKVRIAAAAFSSPLFVWRTFLL